MLAINIPADGFFMTLQEELKGVPSEERCTCIVQNYLDRFLSADPDVVLINVCYRRCLTPSEVFDSFLYDVETDENGRARRDANGHTIRRLSPMTDSVSPYFMSFLYCARDLMKQGIDVFKIATRYVHQMGKRVFLSVRMNDSHYADNPAINSSFSFQNDCEHTLDRRGQLFDFSQAAVQNYYYAYIEELMEHYGTDGIELDWLRYPTVLPEALRTDTSILSDYMKRLHRMIKRHNPDASIAVRVLAEEQQTLAYGLDAAGWVAEGLVDQLTVENSYVPANFEIPVSDWRGSIAKKSATPHHYTLLCGTDWAVSCVKGYFLTMNPALVRGFVHTCLERGADGIYLFNFFEEINNRSLELIVDKDGNPTLEDCFLARMHAANDPNALPRRCVHIGADNKRYPISLGAGECYSFAWQITPPFARCKLILGLDADVSVDVRVNGARLHGMEEMAVPKGFEYVPASRIENTHSIHAITQAAPIVRVGYLPCEPNESVGLTVEIENKTDTPAHLLWIELDFE